MADRATAPSDYRVLRETLEMYERGYPHTDAARDALRLTAPDERATMPVDEAADVQAAKQAVLDAFDDSAAMPGNEIRFLELVNTLIAAVREERE